MGKGVVLEYLSGETHANSRIAITSGYPNPVKRGETYTIYREKCDMSNAVVNVLSTDGSLVGSFTTGDNKQATVDTSAMNSGLYLYNVVRKNKLIASGRFIVE